MGPTAPLLLAPVEGGGLGGPFRPPAECFIFILRINEKKIPGKSIDIWVIYDFIKILTLGTP